MARLGCVPLLLALCLGIALASPRLNEIIASRRLDGIEGCPEVIKGKLTASCAVDESTYITIRGTNWNVSASYENSIVLVGGVQVPMLSADVPNSRMHFSLPPGSGQLLQVTVRWAPDIPFFATGLFVSYLEPEILEVEGCGRVSEAADLTCRAFELQNDIILHGARFHVNSEVFVGAAEALSVVVESDTRIRIRVDATSLSLGVLSQIIVRSLNGVAVDSPYRLLLDERCPSGEGFDRVDGTCSPCPANDYSDASSICLPCPGGTVSSVGASFCTPCPPGKARLSDQPTCTNCQTGKFAIPGSAYCSLCAPGRFTSLVGSGACSLCPAGSAQNLAGRSSCFPCDTGTSSEPGATECRECGAGKVSIQEEGSICKKCLPGKVAVGHYQCRQCAFGTFAAQAGQNQCLPCPGGRSETRSGSSSCVQCAPGTFAAAPVALVGAYTCQLCGLGHYASEFGAEQCLPCPPGTYAAGTGAKTCSPCERGSWSNATGAMLCTMANPGSYVEELGRQVASPCPAGMYTDIAGQYQCKECLATTYAPPGSKVCIACPAGRANNLKAQGECLACPPGKQQPATSQASCLNCLAGWYKLANMTLCAECPTGRYGSVAGMVECEACPEGRAQSSVRAQACTLCGPGKYQDTKGQHSCIRCPEGTASTLQGVGQCSPCGLGRFANATGQLTCDTCPKGKFSKMGSFGIGASNCEDCAPGSYGPVSRLSKCVPCAPGRTAEDPGSTSCTTCPKGRITAIAGLAKCAECAVGFTQSQEGQASCTACDYGKHTNTTGSTQCIECAAGTFSDTPAQEYCTPCPPGTRNSVRGQEQCRACEAGRYASQEASQDCSPCPNGRFGTAPEASNCTLCAAGTYLDNAGGTFCYNCASGKVSSASRTTCEFCPPGTFAPDDNIACEPCRAGTISIAPGSITCTDCEAGFFSVEGSSTCEECPAGKANEFPGQGECSPCSKGTFSGPRALACTLCPTGTFSVAESSPECTACPAGTFVKDEGSSECTPCYPGWVNPQNASAECTSCPAGKFAADAFECVACRPGRAQPQPAQTQCEECQAGRMAAEASVECDLCPIGTRNNVSGSAECFPCPEGTKQEGKGGTECLPCPVGYFNQESGRAECNKCPGTTIAPEQGSTICLACSANALADELKTRCICTVGQYALGSVCKTCPLGALCTESGQRFEALKTKDGWWREHNETDVFYRCLLSDHCKAGLCAPHRTGRLCSSCQLGFSSSTGLAPCKKCPEAQFSVVIAVLFCLLMVVLLVVMFAVYIQMDRQLIAEIKEAEKEETSIRNRLRITGSSFFDVGMQGDSQRALIMSDSSGVGDSFDLDASMNDSVRGSRAQRKTNKKENLHIIRQSRLKSKIKKSKAQTMLNADTKELVKARNNPSFTFKMKIIVGFFQVVTNLTFVLDIPWPSYYVAFMDFFSIVNLEFIPWQSVECAAVGITYYEKNLVIIFTPIAMIVVAAIYYIIDDRCTRARMARNKVEPEVLKAAVKFRRRLFWKVALFTMFLVYPALSSSVLGFFLCQDIAGSYYLRADFTLRCYTALWEAQLMFVIPALVVFPLGIPLFFLFMVGKYQRKNRLQEPDMRLQLGFLYAGYNKHHWWWEQVDMANKLTMTALVAFFPDFMQLPAAIAVAGLYLIGLLIFGPYIRKGDQTLHIFAQCEVLMLCLGGHLIVALDIKQLDLFEDIALSTLFITATCAMLGFFLLGFAKTLWKLYTIWRKKKNTERAMADGVGVEVIGLGDDLEEGEDSRHAQHRRNKSQADGPRLRKARSSGWIGGKDLVHQEHKHILTANVDSPERLSSSAAAAERPSSSAAAAERLSSSAAAAESERLSSSAAAAKSAEK